MLHPWKLSRSSWMVLWATWSSGKSLYSLQRGWTTWSLKIPSHIKHSMILWYLWHDFFTYSRGFSLGTASGFHQVNWRSILSCFCRQDCMLYNLLKILLSLNQSKVLNQGTTILTLWYLTLVLNCMPQLWIFKFHFVTSVWHCQK